MSDRWERRNDILWIQIISALSVLALALLVSSETIQVWHIFVLGAITPLLGHGYRVMNRDEAFHQLASAISLA